MTPYDLEVLRDHVVARVGSGLRVEVRLPTAHHPLVDRAFRDLVRGGVVVDIVEA